MQGHHIVWFAAAAAALAVAVYGLIGACVLTGITSSRRP